MTPLVQLSVRIPPRLRTRLAQLAAAEGRSVQAYVTGLLEHAAAAAGDGDMQSARQAMAEFLDGGGYARYIAAIEDPDLRNT